jgi:hypothetical protein
MKVIYTSLIALFLPLLGCKEDATVSSEKAANKAAEKLMTLPKVVSFNEWPPSENPVHVRDLHATILQTLGIDHERMTYKFQGLDQRLTGVEPAKVIKGILA